MAILKKLDLSFEFVFRKLDDELWVQYEFYFRWKRHLMIRDDIFKRSPIGWAFRSPGAFRANELDRESFLPVLDQVLETNKPGYWKSTEPDVIIAFYPERRLPLLVNGMRLMWKDTDIKNQKNLKLSAKNKAKSPDDIITMVAMVDAYNLKIVTRIKDRVLD